MNNNNNQSTKQINSTDWHEIRGGLITIIDQYLIEQRKGQVCDDSITGAVWYFFGAREYTDKLYEYKIASVSALRAFASTDVGTILTQKMGEYNYDILCQMLEGLVKFCCTIKDCEMFMAELDHIQWNLAYYSDSTIESIKKAKEEYERKLKNLMEYKSKST